MTHEEGCFAILFCKLLCHFIGHGHREGGYYQQMTFHRVSDQITVLSVQVTAEFHYRLNVYEPCIFCTTNNNIFLTKLGVLMCYIYYILLLIMTRPSAKTQTVKEGYIFILTITTCSYLVTQQQVFCHTWQQSLRTSYVHKKVSLLL